MACERCKSRKLKCDRQRPSCNRCLKVHSACAYTGRRKPGFPAGQRHLLEDKIRRLEGEIQRTREDARKSADPVDRQSYPQNVDVAVSQVAVSLAIPVSKDPESPPIPTLEKTRLVGVTEPPTDLILSGTSLFFRHIHSWLPFLDIQRVVMDMGSMDKPPLLYYALFGVSLAYSYDPRLDQKSSDSFWTYSKRRIFVDILEEPSLKSLEALTILVLDLSGMTNGPQVWGALSIAVKFCVQLKSVGDRVFRTSAEDGVDKALSNSEQMHRRRLFWAIYALDSYITITTGHPSDLDIYHIQYFMPSRNETWRGLQPPTPNSMDGSRAWRLNNDEHDVLAATPTLIFSYQLKLMDVSRHVHNIHIQRPSILADTLDFQWAQNFNSCSTELFEWFQNLPLHLALNSEGDRRPAINLILPALVMLHSYYHALVIHLHGFAAYPPDEITRTQLSQNTSESRWRCANSLTSLSMIVSRLEKKVYDRLGWPFTWALWIACRYLLVRNRSEGLHDMSSFYILLECLKTSSRFWQVGGKYWRLLNQAAAEFESSQLMGQEGAPVLQNILLAVTDLRIPTSDLEDRSRPDPVIYNSTPAQETGHDVEIEEMISNFEGNTQEQVRMEGFGNTLSEDAFFMSQLVSDNWFTASLMASSGYGQ